MFLLLLSSSGSSGATTQHHICKEPKKNTNKKFGAVTRTPFSATARHRWCLRSARNIHLACDHGWLPFGTLRTKDRRDHSPMTACVTEQQDHKRSSKTSTHNEMLGLNLQKATTSCRQHHVDYPQ